MDLHLETKNRETQKKSNEEARSDDEHLPEGYIDNTPAKIDFLVEYIYLTQKTPLFRSTFAGGRAEKSNIRKLIEHVEHKIKPEENAKKARKDESGDNGKIEKQKSQPLWSEQTHIGSNGGRERKDVKTLGPLWFKIRETTGNITASNAGSFLGINSEEKRWERFKSNRDRSTAQVLRNYERLLDPSINDNGDEFFKWFTTRGQHYEPLCKETFEVATGIPVRDTCMWQSYDYPWLFATPDGIIDEYTGWEVKNPWKQCHDKPPAHYIAQVQIQLLCSNRKRQYFMSQCVNAGENACGQADIWIIDYSQSYIDWMIPQLEYLHKCSVMAIPSQDLELTRFDFTPPQVPTQHYASVRSILELVPDFPEFPPEAPAGIRGRDNDLREKRAKVRREMGVKERTLATETQT